jgi:hypothetical protein
MRKIIAAGLAFALGLGAAFLAAPSAGEPGFEPEAIDAAALHGPLTPEEIRVVQQRGLDAPDWEIGDAWGLTFPETKYACTLVVTREDDQGYEMSAACDDLAIADALFDYNFMGQMTRGLGGVTPAGTIEFFQWPLEDGKSWETRWFGSEVTVRATFDPAIPGPSGDEPGFTLVGEFEGNIFVRYEYLPSLRWWNGLRYEGGFQLVVTEASRGWKGTAFLTRSEVLLDFSAPLRVPDVFEFTVSTGWTSLYVRADGSGLSTNDPLFVDPNGQPRVPVQRGTLGDSAAWGQMDATPGSWRYVSTQTCVTLCGGVRTQVIAVALEEISLPRAQSV